MGKFTFYFWIMATSHVTKNSLKFSGGMIVFIFWYQVSSQQHVKVTALATSATRTNISLSRPAIDS